MEDQLNPAGFLDDAYATEVVEVIRFCGGKGEAFILPHSKTGLIDLVREQQVALTHRDQKIEQQSQFIEQLLEQIRLARHQHFGTRSERFNIDQLALVFNEAETLLEQQFKEDGVTSLAKSVY